MRIADVRTHVLEAPLSEPFHWSFNGTRVRTAWVDRRDTRGLADALTAFRASLTAVSLAESQRKSARTTKYCGRGSDAAT